MTTQPFSSKLVDRLAQARRVAVLTGAGISKESGIPTFRDLGGLWSKFKPQELANLDAFLKNPELVQGWYLERRKAASQAEPNPGHHALTALENQVDDFTLITQNVDNLHRRAGTNNVIELHGNITRSYCVDCGTDALEAELDRAADGERVQCRSCEGLIRPDVVWFGEMLPRKALETAHQAAQRADVFLSVGTSAVVYPAADIPILAREYGAYVAEINVESSAIASYIDESVLGQAGEMLPQLLEAVQEVRTST